MPAAADKEGSRELLRWAEGPVRWLLLPSDWREIKSLESPAEAINFIERFWDLRDSNWATEENEYRAVFNARVDAADQLYGEGDLRGSLTDRGRALILLGPPPHMQLASEDELVWKPRSQARQRSTTRALRVEIWRYAAEDLSSKLVGVLRAADREPVVELKFRLNPSSAKLLEGENSLILVSRLALVRDD